MIQLGLDLDKFAQAQDEKRAQFRSEFELAEDEIAIGIIGRLVPVKNHSLFLQAIAHVLSTTTSAFSKSPFTSSVCGSSSIVPSSEYFRNSSVLIAEGFLASIPKSQN